VLDHTGISLLVAIGGTIAVITICITLMGLAIHDLWVWVRGFDGNMRILGGIASGLFVILGIGIGYQLFLAGFGAYVGYFLLALAGWYAWERKGSN